MANATTFTYGAENAKEKATLVFSATAIAANGDDLTCYSMPITVPIGTTVNTKCDWTSTEIALTIQGFGPDGNWADLEDGALADNTAEEFTSVPQKLRVKAAVTDAGTDGVASEELTVNFWYNKAIMDQGLDSIGGIGQDPS